jgi:glycosyltransferase involved in cell wall biosynthesis
VKVLFVADAVGGVRTFTQELAAHAAGELDLHLALLGGEPLTVPGAASCAQRNLRLEWMGDPWDDVRATADWIEALRREHAPDLIHMNTFAPVLHPEAPVLLTVHSCVLTWWRAVHGCEAPPAFGRYARLVRSALARADAVVTPTRALMNDLAAVYGTLPTRHVIPNGRNVTGIEPATLRQRVVVTAGRLWDEAKNAALVARAAPAIRGRVVLIGPGELPGVQTLGALPQTAVLRRLSRAAVYAEPARYEPFGLAALEAALCGCALVLGDIPSLREVWGDAAEFVSPDDPEELAAAVNALLDDPARAAHAARARAARYTSGAMAGAYLHAYRALTHTAVAA